MTACLLKNEPASCSAWRGLAEASRSESESQPGVQSRAADAKPGELPVGRLKRG